MTTQTTRTDCPRRNRPAWRQQLVQAERGLVGGIRAGSAFAVHFFGATSVVTAGLIFGLEPAQWTAVIICLTVVLMAEMFHQSIKTLVTDEARPPTRTALRAQAIARAAVLVAIVGCGSMILLQFWQRLQSLL